MRRHNAWYRGHHVWSSFRYIIAPLLPCGHPHIVEGRFPSEAEHKVMVHNGSMV